MLRNLQLKDRIYNSWGENSFVKDNINIDLYKTMLCNSHVSIVWQTIWLDDRSIFFLNARIFIMISIVLCSLLLIKLENQDNDK